jgi:hypothetical protein
MARPPIPSHLQQPPSHYPAHMPPFPPTGLQHSPTSSMYPPQQQQHLSHQPPPAMPPMSAQMYRPPQPSVAPQPVSVVSQTFSQPKPPAPLPEISETQRVCQLFFIFIHFANIFY